MPGGFSFALSERHRMPTELRKPPTVKEYHEHAKHATEGENEPQRATPENDRKTHHEQPRRPDGSLFVHFSID